MEISASFFAGLLLRRSQAVLVLLAVAEFQAVNRLQVGTQLGTTFGIEEKCRCARVRRYACGGCTWGKRPGFFPALDDTAQPRKTGICAKDLQAPSSS